MSINDEFAIFWARYPKKRARLAALKAYKKARQLVSAAELLAGLEVFRAHMPEDPQFRPHAGTWLTQGRWADEYDDPAVERRLAPVRADADWFDECKAQHGGACGLDRYRHATRKRMEGAA